jgi:hypothetical protein
VVEGPVAAAAGELLWELNADVETPEGVQHVRQRLHRGVDVAYVLQSPNGHALAVDTAARRITVDGRDHAVRLQLVATIGLPLLLLDAEVLIVHASSCYRDGGAVLISGAPGRGKSSSLIALLAAGWQAVSEDMCTVDLRTDPPSVWPGPPWVRRAHGAPGPPGADVRFRTPDKTAWDIAGQQVDRAVPIAQLIFLAEAGGDEVGDERLATADAVAALARDAVWLADPLDRGRRLFGPSIEFTSAVPVRRLRFPVSPAWTDQLVAVLGGVTD